MGGVAGFAVVASGQVSDFMQMRGPPEPHGKLQEKGALHQFQPGMFVIFVSHQWLSSAHPDPHGEQMKVLRETLGGLVAQWYPFFHVFGFWVPLKSSQQKGYLL